MSQEGDQQPVTISHPTEGLEKPTGPVVKRGKAGYRQTWQPAQYDSISVSLELDIDFGDGVSVEDATELCHAYTGMVQQKVWERAIPVLERTGRIPNPEVVIRIGGNELQTLKWAKDTTGIPLAFRRQFGDRVAAEVEAYQSAVLDKAIMLDEGQPDDGVPGQYQGVA